MSNKNTQELTRLLKESTKLISDARKSARDEYPTLLKKQDTAKTVLKKFFTNLK